jgi:hypothetical protein
VSGNFPKGAKSIVEGRRPFFGAGILVYKDDRTYLRLERAEVTFEGTQRHYANWELRRDGEWVRAGDANDGAIDPAAPVWLRVERRGGRVYGYHSADGTTWTALEPIDVGLPGKVRVGVAAGHNTPTAYSPSFEGLQLYRAVVSMPLPADSSRSAAGLNRKAEHALTVDFLWEATLQQNANAQLFNPSGLLQNVQPIEAQYVPNLQVFWTNVNQTVPAKFKVGEIKIVGNTQIADDAIRERLGLSPGQVITATELQQAEKKLQESRIFRQAPSVTVADPPGGAVKDIVITIQNK